MKPLLSCLLILICVNCVGQNLPDSLSRLGYAGTSDSIVMVDTGDINFNAHWDDYGNWIDGTDTSFSPFITFPNDLQLKWGTPDNTVYIATKEDVDYLNKRIDSLSHELRNLMIEIDYQNKINRFMCCDCGVDTHAISEYYMLVDDVWNEIASPFAWRLRLLK